jgi:hypothetical protein
MSTTAPKLSRKGPPMTGAFVAKHIAAQATMMFAQKESKFCMTASTIRD